jgi:hypothetical protein
MAKRKRKLDDDEFEDEQEEGVTDLVLAEEARHSVLYLEDGQEPEVIPTVVIPDLSQCQCEWPDTSVPSIGPLPRKRCDSEPTVVAFQKRGNSMDDPTGAISLCDDHRVLVEHMYPHQCYFRRITPEKTIGGVI